MIFEFFFVSYKFFKRIIILDTFNRATIYWSDCTKQRSRMVMYLCDRIIYLSSFYAFLLDFRNVWTVWNVFFSLFYCPPRKVCRYQREQEGKETTQWTKEKGTIRQTMAINVIHWTLMIEQDVPHYINLRWLQVLRKDTQCLLHLYHVNSSFRKYKTEIVLQYSILFSFA